MADETEKPGLTPKDIASATALGTATRAGASILRNRRASGERAAQGAGAAARRRPTFASTALSAVVLVALLIAMVAGMIWLGK